MSRAAVACCCLLAACEAPFSFPPPVAVVTVTPGAAVLRQGDTLQLTATILDSTGHPVPGARAFWASSDPASVPVSGAGLVTALGTGTATISATVDGTRGTAGVDVIAKVRRVAIDQDDLTLVPGGTVSLSATPRDQAGRVLGGRAIEWTSSDSLVARVAADGTLEGRTPGSSTVTATVEGEQATAVMRVSAVRFSAIDAGEYRHSCAVTVDGRAFCWGDNGLGQLGVAALPQSTSPLGVSGARTFADVITGGTFTCGREVGGQVSCWGSGARGRLGNGSLADAATPTPVPVPQGLVTLSSGWNHSCGTDGDGYGICWGEFPQVGNGPGPIARTPVQVLGGVSYVRIAAGEGFSCGVAVDGLAYCWGVNVASRLGVAAISATAAPVAVADSLRYTSITAGGLHACGLSATHAVWCWGGNADGQLGAAAAFDSSASPRPVAGGLTFDAVAAGSHSTCALTTSGDAYCWGADDAGQLGAPAPETCHGAPCSRAPLLVAGGLRFRTIAVGDHHACGLTTDGVAYCWGRNDQGQLGDGTRLDRASPTRVLGQP